MDAKEIETLLMNALQLDEVHVTFDGSHGSVIAVSDQFDSMTRLKKQQTVMAPLKTLINEGTIHAISIKTFTVAQWRREKMLNMPN